MYNTKYCFGFCHQLLTKIEMKEKLCVASFLRLIEMGGSEICQKMEFRI